MARDVTLAAQHLMRYLQYQQEEGHQRAYLTDEAKATLRALYYKAREPRQAPSQPAVAAPAPAPSPVQESPPAAPEEKSKPPATPEPGSSSPKRESGYPEATVAPARCVISPEGTTKAAQIEDLKQRLHQDSEAQLTSLRDTMVFSVGNLDAEVMIIGEAPGNDEEQQREPFVGPSGQLLTKIIQAMGLQREMIYISNIVKYRPSLPNQGTRNRKPEATEMAACLPYLMAEIEIVKPRVIVAAGGTAAEGLTGLNTPVGRARGMVRTWNDIPFVVTYHPSYLLRNEALSERRKVWEDMLLVMEVLQMPISEKQRKFFTKAR